MRQLSRLGPDSLRDSYFFALGPVSFPYALAVIFRRTADPPGFATDAPGRIRPGPMELTMIFDYALGGAVTLFVAAYLLYALLRPERF